MDSMNHTWAKVGSKIVDRIFTDTFLGCTYKWFPTPEICMLLERFNAVVFIGDDIAQSIYSAFNILLREDLALGSLQQWLMTEEERARCKCNNQFIDNDCRGHAIKSIDEVKKNEAGDRKGSPYFCESPFSSSMYSTFFSQELTKYRSSSRICTSR